MQQRLEETLDKERSLGHSKHHFSKRPEWTRSQEISHNKLERLSFSIHLPASFSFCGGISRKIRYLLCKRIFKECGRNVNVEKGEKFGSGINICIGDNSGIGINANLPDGSRIGNNVMMGPNFFVISRNHRFDSIDIPMCEQWFVYKKPLVIEDDCWIGRDVLITGGRVIHKGSIIAARCVLTKDFPMYSIVGGNPSRLIKSRKAQ